jgi:hypothetical protein
MLTIIMMMRMMIMIIIIIIIYNILNINTGVNNRKCHAVD